MMEKGFSLVEVLVSITILSIVIGIAIYSLKYTLNILDFLKTPSTQEMINLSDLRDSINSLFFFLSEDEKSKDMQKRFKFFFKGNNKELIYITTTPIFNKKDSLYIEHVFVERGNVYVKEYPVYNPKVDYKNPKIPRNVEKQILLKKVKKFKISYFINKWQNNIKNNIPKVMKITLVNQKNEKFEIYIKPESDFYFKKELSIYLYNPI